ncbi:MAG: EAL domain-containing protein [Acidobacteriota bacterium]
MRVLIFDPAASGQLDHEIVVSTLRGSGHVPIFHDDPTTLWQSFVDDPPAIVLLLATGDRHVAATRIVELAKRIREHQASTASSLIALVPSGARAMLRRLIEAGIDDFLIRPVDRMSFETRLGLATQRLQHEIAARLEASEDRYRSLVAMAPDAVAVHAGGRLVSINPAGVRMLGARRAEDVVDRPVTDFFPPLSRRRATTFLRRIEKRRRPLELSNLHVLRLDGSVVDVELVGLPFVHDGAPAQQIVVRDVTERRRAESALRKKEERFRSLVQNASDLISIVDAEGTTLFASPSFERILGFTPEERIGRSFFEHVHPEDVSALHDTFRQLLAQPGRPLRMDCRIRHRDGSFHVLESVLTNLLEKPAVGGIVINARDVTDRKEAEAQLIHDALHDALTGLPNRALLMDRLEHALARGRRVHHERCAVIFLDLDRFKMVNDSFGHSAGDQLLVQVAERLTTCLRPSDTLARLGGDEFAILLEGVREAAHAVRVAERIGKALAEPFEVAGREVFTSASLGIAMSATRGRANSNDLLRDADIAMYRAKTSGRSGYAIFDARMHAQALAELELETDLRRALDPWQFEVVYQPVVTLGDGKIAGFEALVRWRHPNRGLLLPEAFLPAAEDTGLILELGRGVLRTACEQLQSWRQTHGDSEPLFVSVNLSTRQFSQTDLVGRVESVLRETGLPGSCLMLEITEQTVLECPDSILTSLVALKRLGVRLSLDDFGTGYSSISVLHQFPFETVKIDRWFVRNVGTDPSSDELVAGVLAVCQGRRLATIAEGVETDQQRERLEELECDLAQGYLFSKPLDAEDAELLLTRSTLFAANA